MIKKIGLENYKAFKEGQLKIKPLTILLGVNSVGKTSLLNLPLLMKQQRFDRTDITLKLNGRYVNFGEPINIVHKKQAERKVSFKWELSIDDVFSRERIKEIPERFDYGIRGYYDRITNTVRRLEKAGKISSYIDSQINKSSRDIDSHYYVNALKKLKYKLTRSTDFSDIINNNSIDSEELESFYNTPFTAKQFTDTIDFLDKIRTIDFQNVELRKTYRVDNDLMKLCGEDFYVQGQKLIGYDFITSNRGRNSRKFSSDILDNSVLQKYAVSLNKTMENYKNDLIYYYHTISLHDSFCSLVEILFKISDSFLQNEFNERKIYRVGPLRAAPKRYYLLRSGQIDASGFNVEDGDRLIQMIKDDKVLKEKVNKWLCTFGFEADVSKLRDIIHSFKISQNGLDLDVTDVGFGLSQILPVIVQGFSSNSESLTIIEQPEIHLHPKMQSSLADLFISMVSNDSKNFLIETHSEHFLRRLRRRIVEGEISKDDVAIYFLHGNSNTTTLEEIEHDEKGGFEFPKEFIEDEILDSIAYLKAYSKE